MEIHVRNSTPSMATTTFGVQGMTCSACTHSLEDGLSPHPAIQAVSVSLMNNSVKVTYDTHALTTVDICGLIDDLGYEGTDWETTMHAPESAPTASDLERVVQIRFEGANSSEAMEKLNNWLSSLPVASYTPISTPKAISTVRYQPSSSFTIRTICASTPQPFKATVYHPPSLYSRSREIQIREAKSRIRQFLIALVFAIPTFVFGIIGMIALPSSNPFRQWCDTPGWWGGASRAVVLLFVFATLTMLSVTRVFFVHGFASLQFYGWSSLIRFGNMDLLVALSTGVAYVASIVMMVIDIRADPVEVMDKGDPMRTYFDAVVFLSFFILMGRALESRARLKTGDAIAMLGQLRPETALIVVGDESSSSVDAVLSQESTVIAHPQDDEKFVSNPNDGFALSASAPTLSNTPHGRRAQQIHIDEIELGDLILIPPGSIPPADGEIVDGTTTADESSLTGESVPVLKSLGDKLFTGTTNITSVVTVRVTKLGNETALQQIVHAVGESLDHKAPIEELADRVTAVFVPIVIYMTLIVLAIWLAVSLTPGTVPLDWFPNGNPQTADRVFFAFQFAIALLAIACPCGIGLAAPAAQVVGAGMAVKAGILAQGGGTAFQLATQVDTVVFDKTGTLTRGTPEVVTAEILRDDGWILGAVRLIEEGSTHPLAAALVKYTNSKEAHGELKVLEMEEVAGRGTKGRLKVDGHIVSFKLGSEAFMDGVILPAGYNSETTQSWKRRGYSVVILSLSCLDSSSKTANEQLSIAARFAIFDPPRDEAAGVIASLRRSGKSVWMLSGDNETTARAVGHELGIAPSNVKAGVLPLEKSAFIQELKGEVVAKPRRWGKTSQGKAVVMFAGDGLNDSAAVAAADVGVAFSHGSQVTLSSASFVLLQTKAPLGGIVELLNLSKKVYRRQKLNFAWALCYNVAMIPLAAGAFYPLGKTAIPPTWSALAMALSSLSVVLSSLALRYGL